ncbi:mechanosensitive ion channel family protein [Bartonella sp. CB189]|uniref:mechanosensitive ion channel family protein n=1 Tax=Bartonella sp. CB189 TaxID=3112254 RepID=UPI002F9642EC
MYLFFKRKLPLFLFTFGITFVFIFCTWGHLGAQNAIVGQSVSTKLIDEVIEQQQLVIKTLEQDTEALKQDFERKLEDVRTLAELRLRARDISKRAIDAALVLRAPLNDINVFLGSLTESNDDSNSSQSQSEDHDNLIKKKAEINEIVLQFEEIFLATNKIAELTASQYRDFLKRTLTHRFEFSIPIIKKFLEKSQEATYDFTFLLRSWWKFVCYLKPFQLFLSFLLPLFLAIGLSYFSRKAFAHIYWRITKDSEELSYLQRLSVAFTSILFPSLICVICVYSVFFLFHSFGLDAGKLTMVFYTIGHQIILVFLINRLASVLLASKVAHVRFFNVTPSVANQLVILFTMLGGVLAIDVILDSIYQAVLASLSLIIFKSFIAVFFVAMLLFAISFVPLRFRRKEYQGKEREQLFWPFYIRISFIVLGVLLIIVDFGGYVGLARFLMQKIVIDGALFVFVYLGVQSAKAIGYKGQFIKTSVGHALMQRLHLEDKTMDKLGIAISIFLNFFVILFCAMLLLIQFGFSYSDLKAILWQLATGFQMGNISISLIAIITGILVFSVCFFLLRRFIIWLDDVVLVRGDFDLGVRNSIKTVINYGGVVVSALIGLSTAGLDLRNFALIAGGLSLGIGFGLQNIVQNFVSGLIILIGRPFQLGDYVESGSVNGIVKRISVRATELETFQRKTVIIPNSSLINNNVINWTRRNKIGRIDIPVAVSSNVAPERIVDILLEISSTTEEVLKNPAPQVNFVAFDNKQFSFTLAVYVPNITSTSAVVNTIRFALYKRFFEEGILEC